ncbi:hypothetical protein V6N13_110531 [Hibiscus sabdariffa]
MVEDTVVMKALAEKTMVVEVSLLSCIHVLVVFLVLLILFVTLPVSSMKVLASFFLYSLHHWIYENGIAGGASASEQGPMKISWVIVTSALHLRRPKL